MKRNGNLTSQCILNYWGTHLDTGMLGAISCNVVTKHGFSRHNCATK